MIEVPSYRDMLKEELNLRSTTHRRFSLRAMAKKLDISPSLLSAVINGTRDFSNDTAERVTSLLKFDSKRRDLFMDAFRYATTDSEDLRAELKLRIGRTLALIKPNRIPEEKFDLFSEWFNPALLELATSQPPAYDAKKFAGLFGVDISRVESAISGLVDAGLLERFDDGVVRKSPARWVACSAAPNSSLRKFHLAMLRKAAASLETQSNQEKFVGSETFVFDKDLLPEANAIIEDCFARLVQLAANSPNKNAVYHAHVQLFRLTQPSQK